MTSEVKAVVDRIDIITSHGRTKMDFLKRYTKNIDCDDTDIDKLIKQAYTVRQELQNTGMFKSVKLTVDTSEMYEDATTNGYQLIYEVDEKLLSASTSTQMDAKSGNPDATVNLRFPNLLGRGEQLKFEIGREFMQYEKNNSILPNVSAEFAKLCANGKTAIVAQILHQYHEKEWSNISEENMTGEMKVSHQLSAATSLSVTGKSRLLNMMGLTDKDIPLSLREQFGYAKKHSVVIDAIHDTTKFYLSTVVPMGGSVTKFGNELWSDGFRSTFNFSFFQTIMDGVTAKFEASTGFVKSNKDVHHSDKFFIGGQHNLRGLSNNSYGPRDVGCALGGNALLQAGIHVYSSLEFLSQVTRGMLKNIVSPQVALHAFAIAGNVNSVENLLKDKLGFATSFGAGVVVAIVQGLNFEVNCVRTSQDRKLKFNSGFTISI